MCYKKSRYILAFYELNKEYGGAEEGGWWYNTGQLVRVSKVFATEDVAYRACRRANNLLERIQRHKRQPSSMAYSGGVFGAMVFENLVPRFFPERRPHYE